VADFVGDRHSPGQRREQRPELLAPSEHLRQLYRPGFDVGGGERECVERNDESDQAHHGGAEGGVGRCRALLEQLGSQLGFHDRPRSIVWR